MARRGGYVYRGGRGRGFGPRRVIGELSAQPNQTLKSQLEEAFDFDEASRKFDKSQTDSNPTTEGKENESTTPKTLTAQVVYDKKSSFFDQISCETLDRQSGHDARVDRGRQRQLDVETFGQSASVPMRRGGRGYRRGGMGNYSMMHHGGGGYQSFYGQRF